MFALADCNNFQRFALRKPKRDSATNKMGMTKLFSHPLILSAKQLFL